MNAITIQQLSALMLLIDFLFGITFGIVGGAVIGSRRGFLTWPAADGPVSAGARVLFGIYLRGYERASRPNPGQPTDQAHGKEGNR